MKGNFFYVTFHAVTIGLAVSLMEGAKVNLTIVRLKRSKNIHSASNLFTGSSIHIRY